MRSLQSLSNRFIWLICSALFLSISLQVAAKEVVYSKIPIREVTVFKDGHAFVLHEGCVQTDAQGNVILDTLPSPVMGTFWAYSAQPGVKLVSVVSSRDEIQSQAAAASVTDLLKANLNKQILIRENSSQSYQAQILKLLDDQLVLLKLAEGTKALPINQIRDITFLESPSDTLTKSSTQDTLTLKFDRQSQTSETAVGMAYVQKGIRWIPNYRVEIDGKGHAIIKLQGTIVNELADLDDVTAHLVIGAPRFVFQDTPDPISFQDAIAQLSQHFRPNSSTAYAFSNGIMSQRAMVSFEQDMAASGPGNNMNSGPELQGMGKNEDLFVFSLDHITLKKGQRMVLPIAEYTLDYKNIYTVDLPFAPPLEMRRHFSSNQHLELAKLFHAPKAVHKIRLKNESDYPLTTAPAMIFRDGRILAQGMMTYTAIGSEGDLEVTAALDIEVKHSDKQTNLTPNAVKWNGNNFAKVDMAGTIALTNFGDKSVEIHVKRSVMGNIDSADNDGCIKQLGHSYDGYVFDGGIPFWWNWCSWPWWWYRFNSIGQADWTVELKPGKDIELAYTWHYYWN